MKLTDEQKAAVACQGSALVSACPGSGKTRTLIAKLLRCIDAVKETPRKVACITYTNTAVHEIEYRVRSSGVSDNENTYDISTIHVFCLNHVLRPFAWKLQGFDQDFKVLSPDSERYREIMADLAARYGIDRWAQEAFGRLDYDYDGTLRVPDNVPEPAANEYLATLEAEGYLDFNSLIYHSYRLVNDYPDIARSLSARFVDILVDEFQDTSKLQTAMFLRIFEQGNTHYFLVGDPEQSIFGFAGASPDLMFGFASSINAEHYSLSGNFRSNTAIVACAERVIERAPPMYAANAGIPDTQPPIYIAEGDAFRAINDHFLPALRRHNISYGNAAVLAHSWITLLPLARQLRNHGVAIMGPGARPYKREHVIGRLIEPICEYLENADTGMVKKVEKELFFLIASITGKTINRVFTYEGRRVVYRLIYAARSLLQSDDDLSIWLTACADSFATILVEEEFLLASDGRLITDSADAVLEDMDSNQVAPQGLTVADLGVFANPSQCLKLTTMHKSKGREFDAVAMINVVDGTIPYHNYYNPLTEETLAESRRLFYVSATRAQQLFMAFSNGHSPSRFLVALDQ